MSATLRIVTTAAALALVLAAGGAARADDATLRRALADEMAESMKTLGAAGQPRPHHIVYLVVDVEQASAAAKFGGTLFSKVNRHRMVRVQLRVGDRTGDNGNFDSWGNTPEFDGLPADDDYQALRTYLARSTKRAHERAAKALAEKRKLIKDMPRRPDDAPRFDFDDAGGSDEAAHVAPGARAPLDAAALARSVRALSGVFREHDVVIESRVDGQQTILRRRLLTSEGAFRDERRSMVKLFALAEGRAGDGFATEAQRLYEATTLAGLPPLDRMKQHMRELAEELAAQARGSAAESGKAVVLFDGPAAGALWSCLLGSNLSGTPLPRFPPKSSQGRWSNTFFNKMGKPVAPSFVQAHDDPRTEVGPGGAPLFGAYLTDDEGVLAERVSLIEDGVLTSMLMSRTPRREIARSNGHGRGYPLAGGPRGHLGVLVMSAGKAALSEAALREKAQAEARAAGSNTPVYIVRGTNRRINAFLEAGSPLSFATDLMMTDGTGGIGYGFSSGCGWLEPRQVTRLRDGREEAVRGLRLAKVPEPAQLGDVVALGKEAAVYNFSMHQGRFDELDTYASIVSPPVLMRNLTIERVSWRAAKPAYPHPHFPPPKGGLVGTKVKD